MAKQYTTAQSVERQSVALMNKAVAKDRARYRNLFTYSRTEGYLSAQRDMRRRNLWGVAPYFVQDLDNDSGVLIISAKPMDRPLVQWILQTRVYPDQPFYSPTPMDATESPSGGYESTVWYSAPAAQPDIAEYTRRNIIAGKPTKTRLGNVNRSLAQSAENAAMASISDNATSAIARLVAKRQK